MAHRNCLFALLFILLPVSWSGAQTDETESEAEEDEDYTEEIVVTGSRIKRSTFSSISPLQIFDADTFRDSGIINPADILQLSTASQGQQEDVTLVGFVTANGPGTSPLNLRGLGPQRNLVLLNGRRLAPSGVGGAPVSPDLNNLPSALIDRYELLLDGASSVYGSDAVAGVVNVITRRQFDGIDFRSSTTLPEQGNGESWNLSFATGWNFERGLLGLGVEYEQQRRASRLDRKATRGCDRHVEIDENGDIRNDDQFYPNQFGMAWDECKIGALISRVSVPVVGSIYYTPGFSNGGWPNFSESSLFDFGIDGDGDGETDITFRDYSLNGSIAERSRALYPDNRRLTLMTFGEMTLDESGITPYFELTYADRTYESNAGPIQLFPLVPALNPFNLCNPNAPGGVDCGDAVAPLADNPIFIESFRESFAEDCAALSVPPEFCIPRTFGLVPGSIGPQPTIPIVSVAGDRNGVESVTRSGRLVAGIKGDLPFNFPTSDWTWDVSVSYSESNASSSRVGVREDRLNLALGVYSSTNTPCENDLGVELAADTAAGCVPVNMFAPSLYPVPAEYGSFETAAERDYVFGERGFRTIIRQRMFTAYTSGTLFSLPDGDVMGVVGVEWRNDETRSKPSIVARDGLFFGFIRDGGASGDKSTREAFVEVELPLARNRTLLSSLDLNLSGRLTDDQFYGSDTTYSIKVGWRPFESLLLRHTYGTSFRAPNLREIFLAGQGGFANLRDPCIPPEDSINILTGEYEPARDPREAEVLENCRLRAGVDPTTLGVEQRLIGRSYSAEILDSGTTELEAERSDNLTYGFAWTILDNERNRLDVGGSFYDTQVNDTIIGPSFGFVLNDCYTDPEFDSVLCDRINRGADGLIDTIEIANINRDEFRVRGIDYNVDYRRQFTSFGQSINSHLSIIAHRALESSTTFSNIDGEVNRTERVGRWGTPVWSASYDLGFSMDRWRLAFSGRWLEPVEAFSATEDDFGDVNIGGGDTCLGPPTDVRCRDFAVTDSIWYHNVSVGYEADRWSLVAGVRNVFDPSPPQVDSSEVPTISNTPLANGYDLNGRVFFVNFDWYGRRN